jgi:peptidoglycan/xylan/chitin deacetylase (PgdA/CDA1 family)/folate-dependent phosphoribosylglycinamide formyltransferase PurN
MAEHPATSGRPPFRVAVLTGSEAVATRDCLDRIVALPTVEIAAVVFDRGVVPLPLRLRRFWRQARREGALTYVPARIARLAAGRLRRLGPRPFDTAAVRHTVFPDTALSLTDWCQRRGIRHIAVDSLNDPGAAAQLATLGVDLGIVIGTRILRPSTFTVPRLGSINIHKGKVPEYRGQPPGFWELYHGEREAGVTVHQVVEKLDAGPILAEGVVEIGPHETPASLRWKLDQLGAVLLRDAVQGLAAGTLVGHPQSPGRGRVFTLPTRRERATLDRRLGIAGEHALKAVFKRALYASLLFGGPVAVRNTWLRLRRRTRYTVLLYHRVNDVSKDILTIDVDSFIRHLVALPRRYPVVSLRDAVEGLRQRCYLGPNVVVVTFDDGYADNAEIAAPLLKHFDLPATFFVTAGLIGTERRFPHDDGSPYAFRTMTWEQVRALQQMGFDVGSHGWSHLNLGRCSLDEAQREVRQSREELDRKLEAPVRFFAYPFGGRDDITPAARREILAAGFTVVASAFGGVNVDRVDPHDVLRTGAYADPLALRAVIEGIALATWRERVMARWGARRVAGSAGPAVTAIDRERA